MPPDRVGRRLRIVGPQRLEDRDMIAIALLDRAWLRDSDAAVVEHERIEIGDEVGEQRIAASSDRSSR